MGNIWLYRERGRGGREDMETGTTYIDKGTRALTKGSSGLNVGWATRD